jgi:hypothetical protein
LLRSDGTEAAFELLRILRDVVEDAAAIEIAAFARLRAQVAIVAEEAFEERTGIERGRQRLGFALPGEVVGVGAGVTGIAVAGLLRVFHADFERGEARLAADLIGDDLVGRDTGFDGRYGMSVAVAVGGIFRDLFGLHAGEITACGARMVAAAIEQGAAAVVGQIAQQEHVLFERLHRLQDAGELSQIARVGRVPVVHDGADRHIHEGHAHRRLYGLAVRERGHHGVEERQPDGCSHSAKKRAPCERLISNCHLLATSFGRVTDRILK